MVTIPSKPSSDWVRSLGGDIAARYEAQGGTYSNSLPASTTQTGSSPARNTAMSSLDGQTNFNHRVENGKTVYMGDYDNSPYNMGATQRPPQQPAVDIQAMIRQLQEQQAQARIAELQGAKKASLSQLGSEREQIDPRFYEAQRQVQTSGTQAQRALTDFMAQRGLQASGVAAQGEMQRSGQMQQSSGDISERQAVAHSDLSRRESDLRNAYQSDVAAAQAGSQAQMMQNLINQANMDRQFSSQEEQNLFNRSIAEAGLTGLYRGMPTIQAQQVQANIAQSQQSLEMGRLDIAIKEMQVENMPEQIKNQARLLEQQLVSGDISNEIATFNLEQLQDPNSPINRRTAIETEMAQLELDALPEKLRLQMIEMQKRIAEIGRVPYRSPEQVELEKLKVEAMEFEVEALKNPELQQVTIDTSSYLKGLDNYIANYFRGDRNYSPTEIKMAIADYIRNLNLPQGETIHLLRMYGINTTGVEAGG